MLGEAARNLGGLYNELTIPVRLIAGSDDRIVDTAKHSVRLHRELATSTLRVVPDCGRMVHHAVPEEVVGAIVAMGEGRGGRAAPVRRSLQAPISRQWLHIGEDAAHSHHAPRQLAAVHALA